ncbi:DUF2933 domain-containing protein [Paenibacillus sp. SYP-B3998]|uniref:DUF2933 domain-containing protein n=1 Tax=Paenibacillus sp. SYP-B3998 TaxID=2678564 RepID=A0A6G4A2I8_9BACL|nr:DUF2933 domain-containing protein [Paenibacillus sp. SYP-B3998]NEW08602.1 DUF2933 domain-containing protein [Paenibacillus sp. SYP-B3998]
MDWSWLLILVCPIMMLFMMKGMYGRGGQGTHQQDQRIEREINELRIQNLELRLREIDNLKSNQEGT